MMFVIQKGDGWYVARSGMQSSYTRFLQYAQVFKTREDAEKERCPDNERVVNITEIMEP